MGPAHAGPSPPLGNHDTRILKNRFHCYVLYLKSGVVTSGMTNVSKPKRVRLPLGPVHTGRRTPTTGEHKLRNILHFWNTLWSIGMFTKLKATSKGLHENLLSRLHYASCENGALLFTEQKSLLYQNPSFAIHSPSPTPAPAPTERNMTALRWIVKHCLQIPLLQTFEQEKLTGRRRRGSRSGVARGVLTPRGPEPKMLKIGVFP